MKIIVTTTYENVDDEWLEYYLGDLKINANKIGVKIDCSKIYDGIRVDFKSSDPTSEVVGTTTYQLIRD